MSEPEPNPWGMNVVWPCGHVAILLDVEHDIHGHQHLCPACYPGQTTCDAEFFDVHLGRTPAPWWQRTFGSKDARPNDS